MTHTRISQVRGRQVLDSRGRPTVEAEIVLSDGATGRASVPSGASTGKAEAVERRDGDGEQYEGRGVLGAVGSLVGEIRQAALGADALDQAALDRRLRELDGTANLARLGGNAVLAASLACVRAGAAALAQPLYRRIADLAGVNAPTLPLPMVNILSGGLHARQGMDVQDFLAVPVGARSYSEALHWTSRIRAAAGRLMEEAGLTTLLADEGGLSPGFADSREALSLMVRAIETAGLRPGEDAAIALDIAASGLLDESGRYAFRRSGERLSAPELIDALCAWVRDFPIVSIEDGLGEDDWETWPALTARLGRIQLIGDDLFATQPDRIGRGVAAAAANSALIKLNQNGTFSGALDAIHEARRGGYATVISARSGETEDSFLADFAVGVAGGQIKIGSVRNSERLAKYNQLLRIEEDALPYVGRAALAGHDR